MPSGCFPMEIFQACPTGKNPRADPEQAGGIIQYILSGLRTLWDLSRVELQNKGEKDIYCQNDLDPNMENKLRTL